MKMPEKILPFESGSSELELFVAICCDPTRYSHVRASLESFRLKGVR